jgi:plasmid stabilization system protein ParE
MRTVVLSKKASQKLEELLEYLETEWSAKVKEDFIVKLDKSLYLIKQFPFISEASHLKKGLHRCVVSKQTILYSQFDSKTIKVVAFFDARMNPDRLSNVAKAE